MSAAPGTVRVAIYTRQSVDEADVALKSVHTQRDCIGAYVKSQQHEGWAALSDPYEDLGFSGKDTNRPAFKRLMKDIEAGRVDVVAVYKVDRLTRSLLDFLKLMQEFERRGVSFVSVTEAFSTTTSVGRLSLNMVATFAQFERETIGERTKDKMRAIRARGRFAGGSLPLGYDLVEKKLVVNPDEAERVRAIFRLYLEKGSLSATVDELNARGWRTKSWTGKRGQRVEGCLFSIESLRQMLDRVVYLGKVRSGKDVFDGVHEPIVDQELWDAVQGHKRKLRRFDASKGKNKFGALLKGVILCGLCGGTMNHTVSTKNGRRHRYYACNSSRRFGRSQCAGRPVPVTQIEDFVVGRVRAIGRDPGLVRETIAATQRERDEKRAELEAELRRQEIDRRRIRDDRANLISAIAAGGPGRDALLQRVGELDERLGQIDERVRTVEREVAVASKRAEDDGSLPAALAEFDGLWEALFPAERARVLALLIERITYASTTGALKITFRTSGIRGLGA